MYSNEFFSRPLLHVARDLIGAELHFRGTGGVIVETEAYAADDPASHSFRGPTARNAAMFGPVGRAYVYRSYGIHWCFNIVCGERPGEAVLVRALAPTVGLDLMRTRRGVEDARLLCSGPGRLCQALAMTQELDGTAIGEAGLHLVPASVSSDILTGPRIGISRAADLPWRFGLARSPFLSRPFPRQKSAG